MRVVSSSWRHPGRTGALLYTVLATVLGGLVTVVSRLQVAGLRGRRDAVRQLPSGGVIVVSNHTSYADGVLLALVCRRMGRSLRLLAMSGVFRVPVLGTVARRLGFIPVDRGAADAADALTPAAEALAAGEAIGIFPEGHLTRHPDRWPGRGKTGAVRLALRSGAPIVPVAMVGAHRIIERSGIVRRLLVSVVLRPRVVTRVGEPIDVSSWGIDPDDPAAVREATDRVMDRITDLVAGIRGETPPTDPTTG